MESNNTQLTDRFGLCQWFHFQDYRTVERTIACMEDLRLRHLRTGISWADAHRPGGFDWYSWVFDTLHAAGIETLACVWHTPPSIAEGGTCASPPRYLTDYAGFIHQAATRWGHAFDAIELWNEPNNRIKWDFQKFDPGWIKFAKMIAPAARVASELGKVVVLGGMIPVDHHWLRLVRSRGALENVDIIAIHAFPGMWWPNFPNWDWESHWFGWDAKLDYIESYSGHRPVWVTETGRSTWDPYACAPVLQRNQCLRLAEALSSLATRLYWYSCIDLDPRRPCIEMTEDGRYEPHEYHMGLVTYDGQRKEAYYLLRDHIRETARQTNTQHASRHGASVSD